MDTDPVTSARPGWADPAEAGPVPAVPDGPPAQRIGRAEREQADQHLRWALAEDVLTIGEFDERLGQVMQAKTREELDRIVADLPRPSPAAARPVPLRPCSRIVAIMGGEDKRGRWRPGRPLRVVAIMGGVNVDLRDAVSEDGVFDIDAVALMGGVEIVVADNANVDLDGFSIMGGRDNKVGAPDDANGPLVRINGYAIMGGVVVRRATKRERRKYPVENPPSSRPAPFSTSTEVPSRRKSWIGRAIGLGLIAALALGPGRAAVTADEIALFGSDEYRPTVAELEAGDAIDVFTFSGGMTVVIPDGYTAVVDDFAPFGSVNCSKVCGRDGSEIEVDATAMFGSVNIVGETDE